MIQASAVPRKSEIDIEPKYEEQLDELLSQCRTHLPAVDEEDRKSVV